MDLLDVIVLIVISGFAISENVMRNKAHAREKTSWFALQMGMRDSLLAYCERVNERDSLLTAKIEHLSLRIERLERIKELNKELPDV